MYYHTSRIAMKDGSCFISVRKCDGRIVYGPLMNEEKVQQQTSTLNARFATRMALAEAAGRTLLVRAVLDPTTVAEELVWKPLQGGGVIAKLDGVWCATVAQACDDGMFELTLRYGAKPVGQPLLCFSQEQGQQQAARLYATRGV